jgi:hypothetical protein
MEERDDEFDKDDFEITIDVGCAYLVTNAELKKKYKGFLKLSGFERGLKAIEYVKKYKFDPNDLLFEIADV